VRSIATDVVRALSSGHALEHLTALQGLLRSIVDAEGLQQQAEREVQNPGRWSLIFPLQCWGMRGA